MKIENSKVFLKSMCMQPICSCELKEANIAFFSFAHSPRLLTIAQAIFSNAVQILGFLSMPSCAGRFLRLFRKKGSVICGDYNVEFLFVREVPEKISHIEEEDFLDEWQEKIVARCVSHSKPLVWIYGPEKVMKQLAHRFLESGALVYYHAQPDPKDDYFALIEEEDDKGRLVPIPRPYAFNKKQLLPPESYN